MEGGSARGQTHAVSSPRLTHTCPSLELCNPIHFWISQQTITILYPSSPTWTIQAALFLDSLLPPGLSPPHTEVSLPCLEPSCGPSHLG